ncbi:MAG: DUF1570 domain-containing protein, partial [Planctomycetota bacterium]|nr:DUF1570 domain-containing protein [Planctomycetota bacterium]
TPILKKSLQSRNGYEVRYAILALGEIGDPRSVKSLTGLFEDKRATGPDRFYAMGVLASIASKESESFFWEQVFDHSEERVRRAAEVGLQRILGPSFLAKMAKKGQGKDQLQAILARLYKESTGQALTDSAKLLAWAQALQEKKVVKPLRRVYGEGYVCITDIDDEAKVREPLRKLAKFRSALARWLEPTRKRDWVTTVRLYGDRGRFNRYGATREFNFIYFTEFYYSSLLREVVAFRGEQEDLLTRRLQHELGHDVLENVVGPVPPWYAEGLCEVYEVGELVEGRLGLPPVNKNWLYRLRLAVQEDKLPGLDDLLAMDSATFYGSDSQLHYAAAWSFCHYLIVKRGLKGVTLLRKVLSTVKDYGPEKAIKAFKGINATLILEKEWRAYVGELLR